MFINRKIPDGFFPHWFSPQTLLRKLPFRTPASKGLVLPDSHTSNAPFHVWRRHVGDISSGFRRLYWKISSKIYYVEFRRWLRAVSISERVLACCKFSSQLDFGANPRDEIHLLRLLINDKPIKLTSGYFFTCDVEWMLFFPWAGK